MKIILKPGDIFLTRGKSFLSKAIRFFTRSIGESRTKINHVGLLVENGILQTAVVVEASTAVKRHSLWSRYGPPAKDDVAVYRAKNLSDEEVKIIVAEAESQVGREYGYFKVLAHLMDWALLGAYVFRRLANNGDYPICSWLVAHSFSKAGKNFGVEPGAASPDDIWDFIQSHPEIYGCVHPLKALR